jgi:hypothetical protein
MKRTLGITLIASGLMATGAFLSTFISNPFASNTSLTTLPGEHSPILVNTPGAQLSILPSATDGRANPVVINVGNGTAPMVYENGQSTPVAYRPVVQSGYEPAVLPRRVVRASEQPVKAAAKERTWQEEALIVGGSAAAGAGIGALAGGKKGAAIGAVSGGVAGLVYDLATRK